MKTFAHVEVEVKIQCTGSWDSRETVEVIRRQAKLNAVEQLNRAVQKSGVRMQIIGDPLVTIVTVED